MPSRRSATAFVPSGSRRHTAQSILEAWRAGKTDATMRSYSHDLAAVAAFMTTGFELAPALSIDAALERLFRDYDSAGAHGLVLAFRAQMLERNLSPASVNRALATLRSISKLARMLGLISWYLEVPGVTSERRRYTRGPSVDEIRKMVAATSADTETETRDAAIVVALFSLGLPVSELCALRREELDLADSPY